MSLLGSGGMGDVYRARDTRLGRDVALKLLSPRVALNPESRLRFEREARAISSLNHPHICTLYDVVHYEGVDALVMEYLEGETLARRLRQGPLPLDVALRYAIEIASALNKAHQIGIIHRDLKPSNIMLTEAGTKLLDFGLAKVQQHEVVGGATGVTTVSPRDLTIDGAILGTWQYMSPEQVKGLVTDTRSDLFAFGAIVHEMVTGRKAFPGSSTTNLIGAILDENPPPISTSQPLAPAALDRLVQKCLAKDPNERWQTARDLLDELRWIADDSKPRPVPRGAAAGATRRSRFGWRAGLGGLIAIFAAGLVAWLWLNGRDTPFELTNQRPLTDYGGSHGWPSFSPDGNMIAYVAAVNGSDQIWVKNVAGGEPLQLTFDPAGAGRLAWSPRGDQIVFGRPSQGIWSVPPLGGPARQLVERGNRPRFSRDGRRLVFQRQREIWIVNADGSEPRRVFEPPALADASFPALSPDGQSVVFFQTGGGPPGDYWIVSSAGGTARRLTFDESAGGAAVWTPDGRSIVFPSARNGSLTLWQVAAAGGVPTPLTFGAGQDADPDISGDGRQLVYTNVRATSAMVLTNAATGERTEVLERQTPPFGSVFSPAGDRIAFFQQSQSGVHLFVVRTDGRDLQQITSAAGEVNLFPRWSTDGVVLYFFRDKPDVSFRQMAAVGGTSIEVGSWSWRSGAAVDPERKRIVYEKVMAPESSVTVVRELATGHETPLAVNIRGPRWSRDGRTIWGTEDVPRPNGLVESSIVACALDASCRVVGQGAFAVPSADDSRVFFLRRGERDAVTRELWSSDHDGKNERQHGLLGPFHAAHVHYDVSARDQVVWTMVQSNEHRIVVTAIK
jgi:Tol biopolymer transport system component